MLETVQGDCIAANKKPPRSELSRSSEGEKHCVVTGKRKGNISDGKEPRGTSEEEQSSGEGENHTQQGHSRAGSSRYRRLRLGHLKMPLAVCENGLMFLPGICVTFKWHLQKTLALVRRVNCGVEARCTRAGQVRDLRGRGKHGTDSWRLTEAAATKPPPSEALRAGTASRSQTDDARSPPPPVSRQLRDEGSVFTAASPEPRPTRTRNTHF